MGALSGLRLIQLQDRPPTETASFLLAEMGMDVIRVEEPEAHASIGGGSPQSPEDGTSRAAYDAVGRNKRSIILNLRTDAGRQAFYRLAGTADVMLEGFRPGVTKRLGIDYETIHNLAPDLVYCSLTGFGQTGPYASIPVHDTEACAAGGATAANIDVDGNPTVHGVLLGDVGGALHAALAIVSALLHRGKTGQGQHIDVSMAASVMTFQMGTASAYLRGGRRRPTGRFRGALDLGAERCRDGKYLSCVNTEARLWELFCKAIGLPELISVRMSGPGWGDAIQKVRERLLTKTRDEWFTILREAGASVAPVLEIDEVLRDPQMIHRGMLLELEHPSLGKVHQPGFPIQFSETPPEFRKFAPQRGEDTEQVLADLGCTSQEINELMSR